ncbi:MAG: hypothetical protein ACRC17_10940 [Culicoidibacterales bacterium]
MKRISTKYWLNISASLLLIAIISSSLIITISSVQKLAQKKQTLQRQVQQLQHQLESLQHQLDIASIESGD